MLNEPPRLVHDADLERGGLRWVLNSFDDAVQHVEQQRLEQRRIGAHRLEVEDLEAVDRQRVFDVVEEAPVSSVTDPLVEPTGKRSRQQVRQGEEATLTAIEDVEVLDRLVDLAVLDVADAIPVVAFQQHAHERVEEMQVLGCRFQRKRIDGDVALPQTDLEIAPAKECRQLAIAVADIEDDGQRVVLLRVRDQEVEQKALAAAGRAQHERVPDVLNVQVEGVRACRCGVSKTASASRRRWGLTGSP